VLLVVVGPERLPVLARQFGKLLVRARNWLQTSPDAALVMRARQEIEAELAEIKSSLMEVQVVRDEVIGAAKQLEESVKPITSAKIDLNSMVNAPSEPTIARDAPTALAEATESLASSESSPPAEPVLSQPAAPELPPAQDAPPRGRAETQHVNGTAPADGPALTELESINVRLQAIMSDLWALEQQLKQRGALDEGWQPPSTTMQMPAPPSAEMASEQALPADIAAVDSAAPEEDEAVLAARKLLEGLTPMAVSYHTPPAPEPAPETEAASKTAEPTIASADAAPVEGPASPARKARKRRASGNGTPPESNSSTDAGNHVAPAEAPAQPAAKPRRRRASVSAARAEEIETAAKEEAS
jgi:Sec-independent protein translocase protein TatA